MSSDRLPTSVGTPALISLECKVIDGSHHKPPLEGLPFPCSAAPQPLVGKIYTHFKTKVSTYQTQLHTASAPSIPT